MSETPAVGVQRSRRSRAATEHLVGEFIESGMGQREFCRIRGVSLKTLKRQLENPRGRAGPGHGGLIAVELAAVSPAPQRRWERYLSVVVSSGRRIEVGSGFDGETLAQRVTGLERLQAMLGLGAAKRIYLAPGATDMRKGFNGLFGVVRDQLLCEPPSGHVFLFSNSQRNRLKLLFWDNSGLWVWVCSKLQSSVRSS